MAGNVQTSKPTDIALTDIFTLIKSDVSYQSRITNLLSFIEANADFATPELIISLCLSMAKGDLVQEYTFDASAQTIDFDAFSTIDLRRVLLITNVEDNIIIYSSAEVGKGAEIGVTPNQILLDYDTTTMDDADELQIYYDYPSLLQLIDEATATITYIGKAQTGSDPANPLWQIERIDTTSGTEIAWADGSDAFNQIWDDRAILTYS